MAEDGEQPLALVLSGGGARGAYEAGVLRYALGKLTPRQGSSAVPRIFCGTSVGAINACALAARARLPDLGVRLLAERWESLLLEDVFQLGWGDLAAIARWLLGKVGPDGIASLLDARPLAKLVREFVPWRELHQNVAEGGVRAVTLSATDVETGHTVIFVESAADNALYSTDASVEYVCARLKPQHALASAAIPTASKLPPKNQAPTRAATLTHHAALTRSLTQFKNTSSTKCPPMGNASRWTNSTSASPARTTSMRRRAEDSKKYPALLPSSPRV